MEKIYNEIYKNKMIVECSWKVYIHLECEYDRL